MYYALIRSSLSKAGHPTARIVYQGEVPGMTSQIILGLHHGVCICIACAGENVTRGRNILCRRFFEGSFARETK
jgi:hypothetical protein